MLHMLGEFPAIGAVARVNDWEIEVIDVDGPWVDHLLVRPPRDLLTLWTDREA